MIKKTSSLSTYLFFLLIPLYFLFTFDHSLWNPDETRDAGIARSMYVDKNFVTPKLNGEAFLEKPPLYYWASSFIYKVTGNITAGTTRLPAVLFGLLGVLFTFLIGKRFFNLNVGLMAAAMLGTSIQYFRISHFALMDSALAALIAGAFYFYMSEKRFWFLIFCILSFYTKGFVAFALIGSVIGIDLIIKKRFKDLFVVSATGALLFLALATPWVWALYKEGGKEALKIFFIDNNFHRFVSSKADHADNSFFLYFWSMPGDFMPWSFIFIGAFISLVIRQRFSKNDPKLFFVNLWFSVIFLFLTISSSKRSIYLLPAFPAAALIGAKWIDDLSIKIEPLNGWEKSGFIITSVLLLMSGLAVLGYGAVKEKNLLYLLIGAVILGFLIRVLLKSWNQKNVFQIFISMFLLFTFSLSAANVLFINDLDQDKTFVPFVEQVKQQMESEKYQNAILVGFMMSEMERGVFSFYFEKNIPDLKDKDDLINFMIDHIHQPLLMITSRNNLKHIQELLDQQFQVETTYRADKKTRSYLLYSKKPYPKGAS